VNDVTFTVNGLVEGHIIEYNEEIIKNPEILKHFPESRGYIAIINSGKRIDHLLKPLVPEEEYRKMIDNPE